jgi:hypothetical protein
MTGFWTFHAPATLAMVLPVLMMPGLDFAAVSRNALAGAARRVLPQRSATRSARVSGS